LVYESAEGNEELPIGKFMLKCFVTLALRQFGLQLSIFPSSHNWYLTNKDRAGRSNSAKLRGLFKDLIVKRREEKK